MSDFCRIFAEDLAALGKLKINFLFLSLAKSFQKHSLKTDGYGAETTETVPRGHTDI